jgi:Tfp pilus assembly protein PilO
MKKSISFLILALGFVFVFLSCEQEEEFINNQEVIKSKNIFIKKVTDPVLIKQFQSKLSMLKSAGGY